MSDTSTVSDASRESIYQRYQYLKSFFQERWVEHQLLTLIERQTHRVTHTSEATIAATRDLLAAAESLIDVASFDQMSTRYAEITDVLKRFTEEILEISERVRPGEIRVFLEQNRQFDDENLLYLAKLYVSKNPLSEDDFDSIDLLVTRLTTLEIQPGIIGRKPMEEVHQLWARLLPTFRPSQQESREIDEAVSHIQLKTEELVVASFRSLQEIYASQVLTDVRDYKKSLGSRFLTPPVLLAIVDYNIAVRNLIKGFFALELTTVGDQVLQLRIMLRTLERQAERDPKLATEFFGYARDVEEQFNRARFGEESHVVEAKEVKRSIDRAFIAYDEAMGVAVPPKGIDVKQVKDGESFTTPESSPGDDFVFSDDVSGAILEHTSDYVAALSVLVSKGPEGASDNPLAIDLVALFQTLEPVEVAAFVGGEERQTKCMRTMVAQRMKMVRFDAWRRKEVGREAAVHVASAYLIEVAGIEDEAQEVINELLKGAALEEAKLVSNARSRLLTAARELRMSVEEARMEAAGKTAASAANIVGEAPAEPIPAGWGSRVVPPTDVTSHRINFPVPRSRAKPTSKGTGRPLTKAGKADAKINRRKLVMFLMTLFVFFGVLLYMVLDGQFESRYQGLAAAKEFAEFEVDRFAAILPLKSAKKIRDVVEVVVKNEWAQMDIGRKKEKVATLYKVLRPSGVSQLFLFNGDRKMVASCLDGKVAVIQ